MVAPALLYIHRAASENYSPVIEMGVPRKPRIPIDNFITSWRNTGFSIYLFRTLARLPFWGVGTGLRKFPLGVLKRISNSQPVDTHDPHGCRRGKLLSFQFYFQIFHIVPYLIFTVKILHFISINICRIVRRQIIKNCIHYQIANP